MLKILQTFLSSGLSEAGGRKRQALLGDHSEGWKWDTGKSTLVTTKNKARLYRIEGIRYKGECNSKGRMLRLTIKRGWTVVSDIPSSGLKLLLGKESWEKKHQGNLFEDKEVIKPLLRKDSGKHRVTIDAKVLLVIQWMWKCKRKVYVRLSTSTPRSPALFLLVILEL